MSLLIVALLLFVANVHSQDPFQPGPRLYTDCHPNIQQGNNFGFPPPPNDNIRKGQACDMFFKSLGILQDINLPGLEPQTPLQNVPNGQFPPPPQPPHPTQQTATIRESFPQQPRFERQSGFNSGFGPTPQFLNQIQQYDKKICAAFKQLGQSVVKGSLEQICCDLICYCQDLETTGNSNPVCHGPIQWSTPPTVPQNVPQFQGQQPLANNFGTFFPQPINNQTNLQNPQFPQFPPNGVPINNNNGFF